MLSSGSSASRLARQAAGGIRRCPDDEAAGGEAVANYDTVATGRREAIALASGGARVVVNDLGGAPDGTGTSRSMADRVRVNRPFDCGYV